LEKRSLCIRLVLPKGQRAGGTLPHTFLCDLLQPFLDRVIQGCADFYIETAADKSQSKRFPSHFSELHANAAENALAGFENHSPGLRLLFKSAPFRSESIGIGTIDPGVMLQDTVSGRAAIAVQTAGCFSSGLVTAQAGTAVAGHNTAAVVARQQKLAQFGGIEPTHRAGKGFFRPSHRLVGQEPVNAFGGCTPLGESSYELLEGLHGGTCREQLWMRHLAGVGIGFEQRASQREPEPVAVFGIKLTQSKENGIESTRETIYGHITAQLDTELEFNAEAGKQYKFTIQDIGG
jgi:hypothetical protein